METPGCVQILDAPFAADTVDDSPDQIKDVVLLALSLYLLKEDVVR
jgi:hypothetical protein